jgi:16S rRNA C1402 (ribose-2'-O) methylase RsmI
MKPIPIYLIAVPIGSYLSDMPIASLQQIQGAKVIFIESMGRLVKKLQVKGYLTAAHRLIPMDKNSLGIAKALLERGESFAILADTGNPCFVDPGYEIVRHILDEHLDRVSLVPLGMSSALDAALSMAGLDIQKFHFCGHFPDNYIDRIQIGDSLPLVFYVAGKGVRDWLEWVDEGFQWKITTLYRNIRDRNGGQIYRRKRGEVWSDEIQNNPGDNYVGIVDRRGRA